MGKLGVLDVMRVDIEQDMHYSTNGNPVILPQCEVTLTGTLLLEPGKRFEIRAIIIHGVKYIQEEPGAEVIEEAYF